MGEVLNNYSVLQFTATRRDMIISPYDILAKICSDHDDRIMEKIKPYTSWLDVYNLDSDKAFAGILDKLMGSGKLTHHQNRDRGRLYLDKITSSYDRNTNDDFILGRLGNAHKVIVGWSMIPYANNYDIFRDEKLRLRVTIPGVDDDVIGHKYKPEHDTRPANKAYTDLDVNLLEPERFSGLAAISRESGGVFRLTTETHRRLLYSGDLNGLFAFINGLS